MGWNQVVFKKESKFASELNKNRFYFVHSYYAECNNKNDIFGTTDYYENFVSFVKKENIYGVQFHPEKSHFFGKKFLEIFLENN